MRTFNHYLNEATKVESGKTQTFEVGGGSFLVSNRSKTLTISFLQVKIERKTFAEIIQLVVAMIDKKTQTVIFNTSDKTFSLILARYIDLDAWDIRDLGTIVRLDRLQK